jgi:hypothetical protein
MDEKRRSTLARRQAMLAERDRRDAIVALAEALGDERRSADVAQRCVHLLKDYAQRPASECAHDLASTATFANALRRVAEDADRAAHDAREQSHWQAQHLAAREERARRLHERAEEAARTLRENAEGPDVDAEDGAQLARKLLCSRHRSESSRTRQ